MGRFHIMSPRAYLDLSEGPCCFRLTELRQDGKVSGANHHL
jgi:hypothetical protein